MSNENGQGTGDEDLLFAKQLRLDALQQGSFATAHDPGDCHEVALSDRRFERQIERRILRRFKESRLAKIPADTVVGHDLWEHRGLPPQHRLERGANVREDVLFAERLAQQVLDRHTLLGG